MKTDSYIPLPITSLAKLFWNGKSQAVRLPKAFRFEGKEVVIRKQGKDIILSPKPHKRKKLYGDWDDLFAAMPPVDDTFMSTRPMNHPPKPKKIF